MFVAGNIVRAFVVASAVDRDARIILANVVLWRYAAVQSYGIALVASIPRYHDARGIVLRAFGVFAAFDGVRAIVGAGTGYGDALVPVIALVMRTRIASVDGVAFVGTCSGYRLAGIADALQVGPARNSITALVGPTAIDNHTLVLIIAFVVFQTRAADIHITFIGSTPRKDDARGIVVRAFGMFAAIDDAGALIGASAVYLFTRTLYAFRVLLAAAKNGITCIFPRAIHRDTRRVVRVAFRMGLAGDECRAFVSPGSLHLHALVSLTGHVGRIATAAKDEIAFVLTRTRDFHTCVPVADRMIFQWYAFSVQIFSHQIEFAFAVRIM